MIVGIFAAMFDPQTVPATQDILLLIARIDEFKGAWRAFGTLAPERLSALRRVATIESIGSSTRIEGRAPASRPRCQRAMLGAAMTSPRPSRLVGADIGYKTSAHPCGHARSVSARPAAPKPSSPTPSRPSAQVRLRPLTLFNLTQLNKGSEIAIPGRPSKHKTIAQNSA